MFDLDKWQEIFYTIRKNKLRTFLTAFSVSWGIFMLILLLGAGSGLENGVKEEFKDDAVNSIWVNSGQTSKPYKGSKPGRSINFKNQDYSLIKAKIDGIEHSSGRFYCWGEFTIRYKNKYSSFEVMGCHPGMRYLENQHPIKGRHLNQVDIDQSRKVTVIGTKVVEGLFGEEDPIGKWIDVRGIQYKVVGVFEDEGGDNELRRIYIPISTAQIAYGGTNQLHQIMFTTGDASVEEANAMVEEVRELLARQHQFDPTDERAVFIWNSVENYQRFVSLFLGIRIFLWIVGIGTIIAGIVGVSNIMLIVVKERTREIGVRKAIGATPGSIIGLFLQESVVITVMAGYTGLLAGIALIEAINWAMLEFKVETEFFRNPQVDMFTALTATILLIMSGLIAGYIPARKAAKIRPIEALRDE
jgi:putative ABC transport system permease protein